MKDQEKAAAFAARGLEHLLSGRYSEAEDEFLAAIAADPDSGDLFFNLGLSYLRGDDPRRAIAAFDKAEALNRLEPDGDEALPDIFANKGLAFFDLGQTQKAENEYKKALAIDPRHPEALNNQGVLLFQARRFQDAKEHFRLAIAARANYFDAWFNLRDVCAELGLEKERKDADCRLAELNR